MKKHIFAVSAAALLGVLSAQVPAQAQPAPFGAAEALIGGALAHAFGGRDYCYYYDGWRGPGWYWCGYAYRRGYGWGGGEGWHGWRAPPRGHMRPEYRERHDRGDFRGHGDRRDFQGDRGRDRGHDRGHDRGPDRGHDRH